MIDTLRSFDLPPSLLTLEITEGVLMEDVCRAGGQLALLRELGIKVALDDFGTGYSGLSYLSSLPADTIKLDPLFVSRQMDSTLLLESMIRMAHQFGLAVVAEGVETARQVETLVRLQCDELQGFHFGQPIPAAGILQALAERTPSCRPPVGAALAYLSRNENLTAPGI